MTAHFEHKRGLILVEAEIYGPKASVNLILALDTGATSTVISHSRLMRAGYDPGAILDRVQMTTGSSIEFAPRLPVEQLTVLGNDRRDFHVIAHTLPPSVRVDGLLGLDVFRGRELNIDFRTGTIDVV